METSVAKFRNVGMPRKKFVWHRHFYRQSTQSIRHRHSSTMVRTSQISLALPSFDLNVHTRIYSRLQEPVLNLDLSRLQEPVLHLDVSRLQEPVLHLDVSRLQEPVLHLDVSNRLQEPVLHLDVSRLQEPVYIWTYLDYETRSEAKKPKQTLCFGQCPN